MCVCVCVCARVHVMYVYTCVSECTNVFLYKCAYMYVCVRMLLHSNLTHHISDSNADKLTITLRKISPSHVCHLIH